MIDLSKFFSLQAGLLKKTPKKYHRFLFERINWDNRLIGITGGRGTGKTTLLLQHLAKRGKTNQDYLYISADHILVEATGLYEIATTFFQTGGKIIAVDEIHKYKNWAQEIKNLYDFFPDAQIIFSGSSTLQLQLGKTDLSRRAVYYTLPVLSLREYLLLTTDRNWPVLSLNKLLRDHPKLAQKIQEDGPILGYFKDYLSHGAYPFILEGKQEYHSKLGNIIEKVLYEDIPATTGIRYSGISVLKKILYEVATSPPFELNIDRMSNNLGVSRQTVYCYLDHLERAGLLLRVMPKGVGATLTRKPVKLYLENTNLLKAIGREIHPEDPVGTIRECFFANQIKNAEIILQAVRKGDFIAQGKYVFEIGGRNKSQRQIRGEKQGYIVKDDIEVGYGNVIPLWLFGFLY